MNNYEEALKYFNHYLFKNFSDATVLNKRGYLHIMRGDYEKAISDLDTAIKHDPAFAAAYRNLGLALIRYGKLEQGYEILQHAKKMDDQEAFTPYYLGIYYEEKRDYPNALLQYQLAKDRQIDYHGIDYKINDMEEWIERHRNL